MWQDQTSLAGESRSEEWGDSSIDCIQPQTHYEMVMYMIPGKEVITRTNLRR